MIRLKEKAGALAKLVVAIGLSPITIQKQLYRLYNEVDTYMSIDYNGGLKDLANIIRRVFVSSVMKMWIMLSKIQQNNNIFIF